MHLTQQITELCLTSDAGPLPFAVLVEQGDHCAWAMASGLARDRQWIGHVLHQKQRREDEAWVLTAWALWLSEVAQDAPKVRKAALAQLEASTPGFILKRPRTAHTALPARALARRWQRRRLHESAEALAANVAARLAGNGGMAHWAATLSIDDHEPLHGDWIVERQPKPGRVISPVGRAQPSAPEFVARGPLPDVTTSVASGLTVIHVIDSENVGELKYEWAHAREQLGAKFPFGVAIVRRSAEVELLATGCIIGERSLAPESLALAAVRGQWAIASGAYADGERPAD